MESGVGEEHVWKRVRRTGFHLVDVAQWRVNECAASGSQAHSHVVPLEADGVHGETARTRCVHSSRILRNMLFLHHYVVYFTCETDTFDVFYRLCIDEFIATECNVCSMRMGGTVSIDVACFQCCLCYATNNKLDCCHQTCKTDRRFSQCTDPVVEAQKRLARKAELEARKREEQEEARFAEEVTDEFDRVALDVACIYTVTMCSYILFIQSFSFLSS